MEGIVNFLKPAGMTSHDAISFFRRLTGIKKIGHTGTLDPMAVGVLPICIGKATRLIEYLEGDKSYRSIMKLGLRSNTQDIWDPELDNINNIIDMPSESAVIQCLEGIKGEIVQQIPSYSAKKFEGKKLYEYARSGQDVPVKEKRVNISNITVKQYDAQKQEVLFDVDCSKGTYIRTICADVGDKLGTGAVMSFLLRTEASGLKLEDSVTEEELKAEMESKGNIHKYLGKPDSLIDLDSIIVPAENAVKFINGLRIQATNTENPVIDGKTYAVFSKEAGDENSLVGIGIGIDGKIKPKKVIV